MVQGDKKKRVLLSGMHDASRNWDAVDGWNPAPPGIHKTL